LTIGPLVGGYLSEAGGWRWLYWIQLILSAVVWVLITFTVPETYAPRLLADRAKKLRKETGDAKYVTEQDLDSRPFTQQLTIFLLRPFQLLFQELIVFFISLYMSVLYGLLYMFFIAYPIVYQKGKVRYLNATWYGPYANNQYRVIALAQQGLCSFRSSSACYCRLLVHLWSTNTILGFPRSTMVTLPQKHASFP
jgi:MFS family permease